MTALGKRKELKFLVLVNHVILFRAGNIWVANWWWCERNRFKAPSPEFWPKLPFSQKNEKSKFNETFRNGFLGNKTIKWHVYIKKKYFRESAKKMKIFYFNTLEQPSWIVQFLGRGTLDFKFFNFFLRKWDQEVSSHQFIMWSWLWFETLP